MYFISLTFMTTVAFTYSVYQMLLLSSYERAFVVVVKCLSSTSQVSGLIPNGNEFPDWVKKSPRLSTRQNTG
jgi:hypothetical protein